MLSDHILKYHIHIDLKQEDKIKEYLIYIIVVLI